MNPATIQLPQTNPPTTTNFQNEPEDNTMIKNELKTKKIRPDLFCF